MDSEQFKIEKFNWTTPVILVLSLYNTNEQCDDGTKGEPFNDSLCDPGVGTS
jgi:hypothetical protein